MSWSFDNPRLIAQDVALATLYVSSKLNDTLKKPRDIILASYGIRFPQLVRKGSTAVDISNVDPNVLEHERKRVLGIERLILETICFNFAVQVPFELVIKLGRKLERESRIWCCWLVS